jgi:hypothetical protein
MFKQHSAPLAIGKKLPSGEIEYVDSVENDGFPNAPTDFAGNVYQVQQAPGHLHVLSVNRDSGTVHGQLPRQEG